MVLCLVQGHLNIWAGKVGTVPATLGSEFDRSASAPESLVGGVVAVEDQEAWLKPTHAILHHWLN